MLARVLIEELAAELTAVLPLPEQEYMKDFLTIGSIQEYENLKRLAVNVIVLDQDHARPQAYQAANDYLIQHCDVLVVIWDGLPARGAGGTGEVVAAARQAGKALLWIHTNPLPHEKILTDERLKGVNEC